MWLKHTLSTQPRHKNSKAAGAYHMGEAFQAVTAPCYVLGTGHGYRTGQIWALKSHKYCPYILQTPGHRYARAGLPSWAHRDQKGHAALWHGIKWHKAS